MYGSEVFRRRTFLLALLVALAALCAPLPAHAMALDDDDVIDNGIPVVYLNIDESDVTIQEMIESPDHSVYCAGTISIDVPEGFRYVDFPDVELSDFEGLSMTIRGRGNTTWNEDKKPFKVKLDKAADLMGLGKNKHWVLIANAKDESLLKDRITAWIGDEMGFEFTPRGVPVDLVMYGQNYGRRYLGSYYLSENVRVGTNRLEIEELEPTDTDPLTITGGYLVQNGSQSDGSNDQFYTSRGAVWATHTPSFDDGDEALSSAANDGEEAFSGSDLEDAYQNNVQQQYIQNYVQSIEDTLFEGGSAYRDVIDVVSAAKYWLVQEVSLNGDAFGTGSTYIYKYRDTADAQSLLYWGPLWDFDYAWGYNIGYKGLDVGHYWFKPMLYDKGEGSLVQEIHRQWPTLRAALVELSRDGGLIDRYCSETRVSAEADWEIYRPWSERDYIDYVEDLKTWIKNRVAWLDENIDVVDSMVHKVTFMVGDEVYRFDYFEDGRWLFGLDDYPEIEGLFFTGWVDEEGTFITSETEYFVRHDTVLTAVYVPDDEITHATDIAFNKRSDIVSQNGWFRVYSIKHEVLPADAQDKVVHWSSSDESVATVEDGLVEYKKAGVVTITATLRNGVSRDFVLEISSDGLRYPTSIAPEAAVIEMTVGEQKPFYIVTDPSPAKIDSYEYASDDEGVVTVDEYGALTAVGPGEARVHVKAASKDADGQDIELETYVTVIVSDGLGPEPEPGPGPGPSPDPVPVPKPSPEPEVKPQSEVKPQPEARVEPDKRDNANGASPSQRVPATGDVFGGAWLALPSIGVAMLACAQALTGLLGDASRRKR